MTDQRHTRRPDPEQRADGSRTRSRWWSVGLAGMTGLALTTVAVAPAANAAGRTPTAADGQPSTGSHRDDDRSPSDKGKKEKKSKGTPVPCDADLLTAAITLANARGGAVLDLAEDCTYTLTDSLPTIVVPLVLNGGKKTTITRAAAVGNFRILNVGTGGDLGLNHLTITGGQTAGDGAGVFVEPGGQLTVRHSTITGNIAGDEGGGIANNGTTRIEHSTIDRNTGDIGAGVANTGLLTITKSQVSQNTAIEEGGGVASTGGTVEVWKSAVKANQSALYGGLALADTIGTITDTHITQNNAEEGGGIRAFGGQLTLRSVGLGQNAATNGRAGGLLVDPGTAAVVADSTITGNTATGDGGGIVNTATLVARHTKVIGNQSGDQGGGIYNTDGATLTLFTAKVVKNIAVTDGGGIFNELGGTVELNTATGTVVIKNRPNNCSGDVPGCVG
ncbi:right-handed parallel beta-helix repeat-containing protein [Salinispora mooreana]|uniref:right-handed parallel beta-helix repeat-containing protein n=1 Tax=Salinispora mooreana TaxID=999545 RepID=UPI0004771177